MKVGEKLTREQRGRTDTARKKTDWGKILSETLTQGTAVLSFILLIRALDTN